MISCFYGLFAAMWDHHKRKLRKYNKIVITWLLIFARVTIKSEILFYCLLAASLTNCSVLHLAIVQKWVPYS